MIARLIKHGDELALVIEPSILEQLNIDKTTPLALSIEGRSLVVTPIRDEEQRRRIEEALDSANQRYGDVLRRLAE